MRIIYWKKVASQNSFSSCCSCFLFDLSLLPIKMHLPLVSPPLDWKVKDRVNLKAGSVPSFFDLVGGYRNCASEQFLYRYRI